MELAFVLRSTTPRWTVMCGMALAIYAGCKWLTYRDARSRGVSSTGRRTLGYLLAWPGMDAAAFLDAKRNAAVKPPASEWLAAGLKTLLGSVLTWAIAARALPEHPLVAGWIGMIGLVFVLHFGLFHLLSLAWRRAGVDAEPLMRNPLRSKSLAEFWGRRWNTAFHELAARFTFRPLRPIAGVSGASLLVFIVSGLIHELVITVPAGGGYGLPTSYFFLQGLGVAAEHTGWGRRAGLGRGIRGRIFTAVVTAAPVVWLFPPPFIRNVILPMLTAFGAM